ncbi:MAG: hypothetical protein CMC18_05475 [Flavobacteriaceae bacterium]|nr:hypothetical protein [Flavobacteriaceae bacterium]
MKNYFYDGTFNGLLTILNTVLQSKILVNYGVFNIQNKKQVNLFDDYEIIETDKEIAKQIWNLLSKNSSIATNHIYKSFLANDNEHYLLSLLTKIAANQELSKKEFIDIEKSAQKIEREKNRILSYLRYNSQLRNTTTIYIKSKYKVEFLLTKNIRSLFAQNTHWQIINSYHNHCIQFTDNKFTSKKVISKKQEIPFQKQMNPFKLAG